MLRESREAPVSPDRLSIRPLFPLALGRVQLRPDPLEAATWLQTALALRGGAVSNPDPGCAWTGDLHGIGSLHRHPVFAPLIARIGRHAWAYLEATGFATDRLALHIQRSWPVVSEVGQVVGRHHHPSAHLSAVCYLNGDGRGREGCLRFYDDSPANELVPGLAVGYGGPIAADHRLHTPWFDVAPRAGLLLLFPARLEHAVLENRDPENVRVSISVDFSLSARRQGRSGAAAEYLAPHPSDWQELAPPQD